MSSLNKRRPSYPEASLTLVLSAAEGRLVMALGRHAAEQGSVEMLFAQDWLSTAQGVELLAPALEAALAALKLSPRHIGRIAAVNGPGSFTGLRLSIITASGLAHAIQAKQAALPYLPLLAAQAAAALAESGSPLNTDSALELWAITHARRGLVHAQGFAAAHSFTVPKALSDILVLSLEEATALLCHKKILAFGSGLSQNRAFFAETLPKARLLGESFDQPAPAFLLNAALGAKYGAKDIEPLYARQSDAEDKLEQIAAGLGLNPKEARLRLEQLLENPPQNMI